MEHDRDLMPLLDHFHPPLSRRRHWEGLHSAWANALCRQLNDGLLPPRYFAEAQVQVGGRVEVDVASFEGSPVGQAEVEVAVWAPPRPTRVAALSFEDADLFEVQVFNDEEGPRLVAAIELVSPSNKDRRGQRRMFAVKCGSYLQAGVGLMIVDVVTARLGNLHDELLALLEVAPEAPASPDLYAGAYRTHATTAAPRLEYWLEPLALGSALPTLPLWIGPDRCLPVDLEQAYLDSCVSLRIC